MGNGKSTPPKKKKKIAIRTIVQVFFFLVILLISINKGLEEKGIIIPFLSTASLHALCPFGGVVSIYKVFTTGTFVQKIHESSFVLTTIGVILAIGFGPLICGWVCPFGSFQEWLSIIGKKIFKKKYNNLVPYSFDKYLRFLRYLVLAMVIYKTASTAKLMFQDIDPYYALFNLFTDEVSIIAYVILGITILLSLIIERPFCKYACPYGAFLGIFNLFRIFKIKRNPSTCVNCKACDKVCPMNIKISEGENVINHQCISCMKCTSEIACPINDTVEFKVNNIKLKSIVVGVIVLVSIFGGIAISSSLGLWKTTNDKQPAKYTEGQFKGQYNPSDIKGSYTFGEISELFNIPLEDMGKAFSLKDEKEYNSFQCKELEVIYEKAKAEGKEVGTESVRTFVALYKGLPIVLNETTYFPKTTEDILKEKANLTSEQLKYVQSHLIDAVQASEKIDITQASTSDNKIKSTTTFKDLLDWKVTKAEIEQIIDGKITDESKIIKDYLSEKGVEFSVVKDELQKLVDSKK